MTAMKRLSILLPGLAMTTVLLAATQAPDAALERLSYKQDILPVMEQSCAACHVTGEETGGLILVGDESYPTLLRPAQQLPSMKLVEPGRSEDSYLYLKVTGQHIERGGMGMRMPVGVPVVDDAFASMLRQWISQGAQS